MINDDILERRKVELTKAKYSAMAHISPELMTDAEISFDSYFERFILHWSLSILAQDLDKITATYPSDWWQALKFRWIPLWLRQRIPALRPSLTRVQLTAKALYPKIAIPEQETSIYFDKLETSWREGEEN